MKRFSLALLVFGLLHGSVAHAQQCPAGQQAQLSGRVESLVRTLVVPGTASGMFSGVMMRKGLDYKISANGSIRVGVFGETGTPPEGWMPQGPAGPGFPSPDAYTFSLIYRIGRSGPWKFAGLSPITIRLGQADPDQAELYFAINDTKTGDNSGSFNVTVKEISTNYVCRAAPPVNPTVNGKPSAGGYSGGYLSTSPKNPKPTKRSPTLPCAGKTPDGLRQGFTFGEYCPGISTTRPIPVEACTYAEAREEARGLVAFGCHLAEAN